MRVPEVPKAAREETEAELGELVDCKQKAHAQSVSKRMGWVWRSIGLCTHDGGALGEGGGAGGCGGVGGAGGGVGDGGGGEVRLRASLIA